VGGPVVEYVKNKHISICMDLFEMPYQLPKSSVFDVETTPISCIHEKDLSTI